MSEHLLIASSLWWRGYVRATRENAFWDVIRRNPFVYVLAAVIAMRARWNESALNPDQLGLGEALLGDFHNYGMSRAQYRSALKQLEKWGIATIRTTTRGTIARLTNTMLFDVLNEGASQRDSHQTTILSPASNHRSTTNQSPNHTTPETINDKAFEPTKSKKLNTAEKELADKLERLLGNEWVNDAGKWMHRVRNNFDKTERVVAELATMLKEGRTVQTWAGAAEDLWKRFADSKVKTRSKISVNVNATILQTPRPARGWGSSKPLIDTYSAEERAAAEEFFSQRSKL